MCKIAIFLRNGALKYRNSQYFRILIHVMYAVAADNDFLGKRDMRNGCLRAWGDQGAPYKLQKLVSVVIYGIAS